MTKEQQRNLAAYREIFLNIKVYKNQKLGGDALNKPILLLSVIELITQDIIKDNKIPISNSLIETFKKYWDILGSASFKGSDFAIPFFHLKNDKNKFWRLKYSAEYDGGRPQTIPKLKEDVEYAYLDSELFNLLQDQNSRQELIDALIAAWFSTQRNKIEDILSINQSFQDSTLEIKTTDEPENIENAPQWTLRKSVVRNAFFRKAVVHLYDYRCAFCKLKVTKSLNQSIVDGAHIKQFAQFYDSRITNGISLCKNHHWAFDSGWFAIDDQYKILITSDLQEESPNARPMIEFHGESLLLPSLEQYFPDTEALKWHRQNIFRA